MDVIESALQLDPSSAQLPIELGKLHWFGGRCGPAADAYARAAVAEPANVHQNESAFARAE